MLTTTCPKCGFISDLVVAEGMRGKGIGSALLARAERYFAEQHCEQMQLCVSAYNTGALVFYERHGLLKDCFYLRKPVGQSQTDLKLPEVCKSGPMA